MRSIGSNSSPRPSARCEACPRPKAGRSSRCIGNAARSSGSSRPCVEGGIDADSATAGGARRKSYVKAPHGRISLREDSMAEFKAVIADPKTGKAYKKDITGHYANALIGKKIGEDLDGLYVGLPGYKLQITGGSDKDGFPMRTDLPGPRRKRLLLSGGGGFHPARPREREKKTGRANNSSPDILQLNLKIVGRGPKSIGDAWQEQAR